MEGNVMMYQIAAVCIACGDLHTVGRIFSLPGGPVNKQSIADAYANKDPPANIAELKAIRVHCHKIGRHYAQKDANKIFIVPVT